MHNLHALSATGRGTYVLVKMTQDKLGWQPQSIREWSCDSFARNYLLLNTGVRLSVPSHFTSKPIPADTPDRATSFTEPDIYFSTSRIDLEAHIDNLHNNLIGVYPHDVHLLTIPRLFSKSRPDSYIAYFHDESVIKAGFVNNGSLVRVFSSVISSAREFEGFAGRITRYVSLNGYSTQPEHHFIIGQLPFGVDEIALQLTPISCGSTSSDEIKAIGTALAGIVPGVPAFSYVPAKPALRTLRTIAAAFSLVLLLAGLSSVIVSSILSMQSAKKLSSARDTYRTVLNTNNDIRKLLAEGDSLSKLLLDNTTIISHPTMWGRFLHFLGTTHPSGLFFERLGTEPLQGKQNVVRVALAGWCTSETTVTEFVKKLSQSSLLKNVTLSSIDRIEGQESSCRFKIICVFPLLEP